MSYIHLIVSSGSVCVHPLSYFSFLYVLLISFSVWFGPPTFVFLCKTRLYCFYSTSKNVSRTVRYTRRPARGLKILLEFYMTIGFVDNCVFDAQTASVSSPQSFVLYYSQARRSTYTLTSLLQSFSPSVSSMDRLG